MKRRSPEDLKAELDDKKERQEDKPFKGAVDEKLGAKVDPFFDLHKGEDYFPFRLRTPGVKYLDIQSAFMSFIFQQLNDTNAA